MGRITHGLGAAGALLAAVFGFFAMGCSGAEEAGTVAQREPVASLDSLAGEEAVVARLAHDFMEALSAKDTATLAHLLAPDAMLYSVRDAEDGPVLGVRTGGDFLQGLGGDARRLLERIWNPVVEVSGRVAMVWAPYDFHLNGAFTHCGIDVLTFLKLAQGWKVTSITYNVVREGCEASPLGEPGE